jgi:hypothetical protein
MKQRNELGPETATTSLEGERRRKRSSDPLVALHYQLSHTRTAGELDALVVADPSGVVVAGAGSWPACEELAAYAPLLAVGAWAEVNDAVGSRVASLRAEVTVRPVLVGDLEVLLCARQRTDAPAPDLDSAAAGITRILSAA